MGEEPDGFVFLCDSFIDFLHWRKALESYVVQQCPVSSIYSLEEQIGKGSHAQVYLATPKYRDAQDSLKQSVARFQGSSYIASKPVEVVNDPSKVPDNQEKALHQPTSQFGFNINKLNLVNSYNKKPS